MANPFSTAQVLRDQRPDAPQGAPNVALWCDLGRADYPRVWQAMQQYTDHRGTQDADQIWVVEHDPVFTQGQAGRAEHVLTPGDIPVLQVDRGGQVTYHGPGQLVIYPLLDLRRMKLGVRKLVELLEECVVRTLHRYHIEASRRDGAPGVYVGERKIAQLGLRVRRGCSFHGLAFNINMDLEPFNRINPCGFAGLEVTQLAEFHPGITLSEVSSVIIPVMAELLNIDLQPAPAPVLEAFAQ